jgi:2-keto-4-pentenoate hydratase/2-oxohepta-3-ene-1,7-dioic acid hydratase in catechol pathway
MFLMFTRNINNNKSQQITTNHNYNNTVATMPNHHKSHFMLFIKFRTVFANPLDEIFYEEVLVKAVNEQAHIRVAV